MLARRWASKRPSSTSARWSRSTPEPSCGSPQRPDALFTVEENPRLLGWGAEIVSIIAEECFWDLDGPIVRITTPHIPLPAADALEDLAIPSAELIAETVQKALR